MHATIEQLLGLRDGEPVGAVVNQHVNLCMLCRERLDELILVQDELNRLPVQEPRGDYWPDILAQIAINKQTTKRRQHLVRYGGFGLAASAILATTLFIVQSIDQNGGDLPQQNLEVYVESEESETVEIVSGDGAIQIENTSRTASFTEFRIDELIARSALLEAALHAMPRRPRVIRASTTDLITGLQDGVALIDYQLNFNDSDPSSTQSRQLWQHRIDLMNSLVNVRYAETQHVAYTPN